MDGRWSHIGDRNKKISKKRSVLCHCYGKNHSVENSQVKNGSATIVSPKRVYTSSFRLKGNWSKTIGRILWGSFRFSIPSNISKILKFNVIYAPVGVGFHLDLKWVQ